MCGIAGEISRNSIQPERIKKAASTLAHRGPEATVTWMEDGIALAHNRLCIIDLSDAASQPLHYHSRYVIIHNGELYNYLELKKELQQKGFQFTSESDTEVIVAAYQAYGKECLQRFDGMFAFAIWDKTGQTLFAARDRFGEKPFFFYYDDERLAFASEMKALWEMEVPREVNRSMLYNFLTIGYTSNPSDPGETFFQNIGQLPPACSLLYKRTSHELTIEKYWQVWPEVNNSIRENEAIEKFDFLLRESIGKRLRSDVPIGTSLSGGLDSSSIVALCAEIASDRYSHQAFTAVFEGYEKSEHAYAETVARKFDLKHHLVTVSPSEIPSLMDEIMRFQEAPVGSASALAQFVTYRAARQNGIKVLLDGQGADETLAGYHKYYKWYWQELYRNKKLVKSGERQKAMELGIREGFSLTSKIASLLPEFAASILQTRKSKSAYRQPGLDPEFAFSQKRNLYYATPSSFDLNGALYFNSFVHGLDELLWLADRNSMAHGVEIRLPFLSHELVSFLFTLPSNFKIRDGWTKWILRKTVTNKLPPEITWRKDKTGFEPPQKAWMQQPEVQERIRQGKKILAQNGIITKAAADSPVKAHEAYQLQQPEWRYWSASYLFRE